MGIKRGISDGANKENNMAIKPSETKPCSGKTKGGGRGKLVSRKHKPTKDKPSE